MMKPKGHFEQGQYITPDKMNSTLLQVDESGPGAGLIPYEGLLHWDAHDAELSHTDGDAFEAILGSIPDVPYAILGHTHLNLRHPTAPSHIGGDPSMRDEVVTVGSLRHTQTLTQTRPRTTWMVGVSVDVRPIRGEIEVPVTNISNPVEPRDIMASDNAELTLTIKDRESQLGTFSLLGPSTTTRPSHVIAKAVADEPDDAAAAATELGSGGTISTSGQVSVTTTAANPVILLGVAADFDATPDDITENPRIVSDFVQMNGSADVGAVTYEFFRLRLTSHRAYNLSLSRTTLGEDGAAAGNYSNHRSGGLGYYQFLVGNGNTLTEREIVADLSFRSRVVLVVAVRMAIQAMEVESSGDVVVTRGDT